MFDKTEKETRTMDAALEQNAGWLPFSPIILQTQRGMAITLASPVKYSERLKGRSTVHFDKAL
jgi:hypothetical protein